MNVAPQIAAIEYDTMPDGLFVGVGKMRATYNAGGDLCVHFTGADDRAAQVRRYCMDAGYEFADMHEMCGDIKSSLEYRYALAIPRRQYVDQKVELARMFGA